ncbi:MAG: hypothetical protein CBC13_09050 [Planctomycetia bacterium TMED53]|nr:MAG: hypothetical protein CBC13_09050 [Planctomycetia bacterium TMED53]
MLFNLRLRQPAAALDGFDKLLLDFTGRRFSSSQKGRDDLAIGSPTRQLLRLKLPWSPASLNRTTTEPKIGTDTGGRDLTSRTAASG